MDGEFVQANIFAERLLAERNAATTANSDIVDGREACDWAAGAIRAIAGCVSADIDTRKLASTLTEAGMQDTGEAFGLSSSQMLESARRAEAALAAVVVPVVPEVSTKPLTAAQAYAAGIEALQAADKGA